ncbi:hypothetical protein ACR2XN_28355, partial [Klebsiella pneumoniae]
IHRSILLTYVSILGWHNCGSSKHLVIDCRKKKKKEKVISSSDARNRMFNIKPQNPCYHCGSKWHSIYVCAAYHEFYHNYYEPLPKLNKSANSDKSTSSSLKHIYVKKNSDKSNSDGSIP